MSVPFFREAGAGPGVVCIDAPCRFARLEMPILLMTGKKSPPSSLGVARVLRRALRNVKVVEFDDLGHMAPLTHPQVVNPAIASFLQSL